MPYHFRNFVFEGGGVKGIAYLGALDVLTERDILPGIQRIGGTSAGAINALLVGLGFSFKETKDILWSLDFKKFLDDSWGIVRDINRLINQFGWYKGDFFRDWIGKLIKEKTGSSESTFVDLEVMKKKRGFKSLYFMGTDLSSSFCKIFSAEHTPKIPIADAIRISMSIPLFFVAKRLRGNICVDGGILENYPIKLFDRKKYLDSRNYSEPAYYERANSRLGINKCSTSSYAYNKETLGFRLDTKEEISILREHTQPRHTKITDLFDYMSALINVFLESQRNSHLHSDDWARTVYIDTLGVSTTDFDLSGVKKNKLIQSGKDCTLTFFKWYDNAELKPNK